MVETTRVAYAGVSCSQDQESRPQPKGGPPSDVSLGLDSWGGGRGGGRSGGVTDDGGSENAQRLECWISGLEFTHTHKPRDTDPLTKHPDSVLLSPHVHT